MPFHGNVYDWLSENAAARCSCRTASVHFLLFCDAFNSLYCLSTGLFYTFSSFCFFSIFTWMLHIVLGKTFTFDSSIETATVCSRILLFKFFVVFRLAFSQKNALKKLDGMNPKFQASEVVHIPWNRVYISVSSSSTALFINCYVLDATNGDWQKIERKKNWCIKFGMRSKRKIE